MCSDRKKHVSTWVHFLDMTERARAIICLSGVGYIIICIPIYCILKIAGEGGTFTFEYAYVVSSAFMNTYAAATTIVIFVCLSSVGLTLLIKNLNDFSMKQTKSAESPPISTSTSISTSTLSPTSSSSMFFSLTTDLLSVWRPRGIRLLLQLTSIAVVVVVNVVYVYILLFGNLSTLQTILLQITMGVFKLSWKEFFIRRFASKTIQQQEGMSGAGALFHEVSMNIFNFILAPCIATLGTDSDCLYYAIYGEQSITSSFAIVAFHSQCGFFTNCPPIPYKQMSVINITPPWLYSFQCTSGILRNYVPVLIFTYVISGVAMPIFKITAFFTLARVRDFFGFYSNFAEKQLRKADVNINEKVFTGCSVVLDMLVHVTILMTFGLAAPLLGVTIIAKQVNNATYLRLWIGRFLSRGSPKIPPPLCAIAACCKCLKYTANNSIIDYMPLHS